MTSHLRQTLARMDRKDNPDAAPSSAFSTDAVAEQIQPNNSSKIAS